MIVNLFIFWVCSLLTWYSLFVAFPWMIARIKEYREAEERERKWIEEQIKKDIDLLRNWKLKDK